MSHVDPITEESRFRALLAVAGLELSDDEIAAVLPDFQASHRSGAELATIDLGDTPPATMFHPEGHAGYPASGPREAT